MKCIWTARADFRGWALVLLALLAPLAAAATHIVGGELDLQHKSGSTYTLSLNLYFDAINGSAGALDDNLTASIFNKTTNQRMADVVLPRVSDTFVNYTNPACTVGSLSTRKLVYTKDITLSAATYTNAAGYYVAVERCCRNVTIGNIVAPNNAAQTFYLEFPAVVRSGAAFLDSTPRIFPPLGDYACRDELFYYDFGGQDPDGDSLAYDMVTPLNGHATNPNPILAQAGPAPYSLINWNRGLGTSNQIPGSPALGIDAHTGRLTVRPRDLGLFVFGVRCSEFRRGVKIGETRRDFQLYVLNCPTNMAPTLQVRAPGSAAAYRPGRDTLRLTPGGNRCLAIRYTDPDPSSTLTMTSRAVNFTTATAPVFTSTTSGTVHSAGAPDTLTTTLCFPDCLDTGGRVYLVDVIVADNGCSLPKHDTIRIAFTAASLPNQAPVLATTFPPAPLPVSDDAPAVVRLTLGERYDATLTGTDANRNALTLSAAGAGFNLADAGMAFAARNGYGRADAAFSWLPTCDAVAAARANNGLLVRFRLAEAGPCEPLPQERLIRFVVAPKGDSLAFRPPNVFTPNGDGLNDSFRMPDLPVDFCDHKFASIKIFSRWGQPVFSSSERGFQWNGAGAGGLYYYLVTYTDGQKYKGWVEVLP
ncbi:gliding motility-associated C-terminal domain-containing protein [Hymenobacter ruricola]|uniref:Gliding motility-associated C-terminal domain-containing protein n=1 Tax=Hymenobacter ruricola TaxID=2791023 RepID=A0ABS0HYI9_9BACT|nr:gliding motility-associated C-terminal domain-containing protein [Hymenobacter ruricola]MBF9219768.1 gliding motility-associated C-terminal domain-containing protein [Hymenobacter ruricola]